MDSTYDRFADFYLEFVQRGLDNPLSLIHLSMNSILSVLDDIRGQQICDLACGEGYLSRALADRGAIVTGIDLSAVLLDQARQRAGKRSITYIQDDAQVLGKLAEGMFDVVVCNLALMDIPDITATFRAVRRVLRQGGSFIFVVLHPCFEAPFRAPEEPMEVDEQANFVACRVMRYQEEGFWNSGGDGVRGRVGAYHRIISTYINSLLANAFQLVRVAEPALPHGRYPDAGSQRNTRIAPLFLVQGQAQ